MNSAIVRRFVNFPNVLSAVYFVALLVQVWNHIMWRDEIRTWQVCREATGLISLWDLMRYEGVPVLWYWIVFVLTRVTSNPFLMQFLHVLIATAVVYVVARWAPFPRVVKVLFAFGYFPFFEYATLTRNYSLVFLLILIACAMMAQERLRPLALAGVLFLLTQVSIWGAGLAGLLLAAAVAKAWMGTRENRPSLPAIISAGAIVIVGFVLCIIEVLPGPGPSFTDSWRAYPPDIRIYQSLGSLYRAWVPIPRMNIHFWNTNILDSIPLVQAILALVLLAGVALSMATRPVALAWLLAGVGALVGFTWLKFRGSARHDGMLFIVLIAACWLASQSPKWKIPPPWGGKLFDRLDRMRGLHLGILLAVSAVAGLMAAGAGMVYPFSATRAVADFIKEKADPRIALASYTDYGASPISQWLDRPIYSIAMHKDVRYNTQDDKQRDPVSLLDGQYLLNNTFQIINGRNAPVLLLLNSDIQITGSVLKFPLPTDPPLFLQLTHIVEPKFGLSVVKDEAHEVYLAEIVPATQP